MLGPAGSNIMAIFRLLSPDEISMYMETAEVRQTNRVVGTQTASGEDLDFAGKDDIGKNDKKSKNSQKEVPENPNDNVIELRPKAKKKEKESDLEKIGVYSAEKTALAKQQLLNKKREQESSATVFLLEERSKLKLSKRKIFEQEALKNYELQANKEFFKDDKSSEEEEGQDPSLIKGILINKKSY